MLPAAPLQDTAWAWWATAQRGRVVKEREGMASGTHMSVSEESSRGILVHIKIQWSTRGPSTL